jgi:hypothetical protein
MTMTVDVVAMLSAATAPGTRTVDRATARVADAPMARPARLDRAVGANMPCWPFTAIAGAAASIVSGNSEAAIRIAGTADAQLAGTDNDPTKPARPAAAETVPALDNALEPLSRSLCSSGARTPMSGFG